MIFSPRMAHRMAQNGGFLFCAIQKWLGQKPNGAPTHWPAEWRAQMRGVAQAFGFDRH